MIKGLAFLLVAILSFGIYITSITSISILWRIYKRPKGITVLGDYFSDYQYNTEYFKCLVLIIVALLGAYAASGSLVYHLSLHIRLLIMVGLVVIGWVVGYFACKQKLVYIESHSRGLAVKFKSGLTTLLLAPFSNNAFLIVVRVCFLVLLIAGFMFD